MSLYEITFSPTGNTKKAAGMISEAWNCEKKSVDLLKISTKNEMPVLTADDICIIAMPVFGGRIPTTADERLCLLEGNGAKAILTAVYGNRLVEDALVEMEDIVKSHGFTVTAGIEAVAEHSIVRKFATGRPDTDDRKVLNGFGKEIIKKISSGKASEPELPGNRPYRNFTGGLKPSAGDNCSKCGICAEECPVGAISPAEPQNPDPEKCISCMRCISVCPSHARQLAPAMLKGLEEHLAAVCTEPRKNMLYI